jgi:hypothetical protein
MKSSGGNAASSVSGTIIRLTSGMALALAIGETGDTCWNITSNGGIRPRVIAHRTRAQLVSQCILPMRATVTSMMIAIAPKDSRELGESTAQGSSTTTASKT